jgi:hypothetical protein
VLKARNPGELINYIKWASVAASIGVSQGKSKGNSLENRNNVILGQPPVQPLLTDRNDVF